MLKHSFFTHYDVQKSYQIQLSSLNEILDATAGLQILNQYSCCLILVRGVFYAFDANGIAILDPANKRITKKINGNTKLPGTTAKICTPGVRSRSNCSWAGAVFAPNKYIFAADFNGNRSVQTHCVAYRSTVYEICQHNAIFSSILYKNY